MRVHVFGNSPSPVVAIHCLHKSVQISEFHVDPDVKHFVMRDFYVDDGLKSLPTAEAAINLVKKTQDVLSKSNLRLHKIAANNKEVMEAFPSRDHASDLKDLDFEAITLPMQHSLGLNWNLHTDCFLFSVCDEIKPYTRQGVLSTINSLYDPLGFVAPVTIQGKAILRELTTESGDLDAPLPQEMEEGWTSWKASLTELSSLSISIKVVQEEVYSQEIKCIQKQEKIPKSSEKSPLIIPGKHHIAALLIRHHHEHIHHQGHHFTEGAVRSDGFWIVGGKRKVSSIIHQCATCRRLRAPLSIQKMSSLPADHLSTDPPFTSVALDVFGPWSVAS